MERKQGMRMRSEKKKFFWCGIEEKSFNISISLFPSLFDTKLRAVKEFSSLSFSHAFLHCFVVVLGLLSLFTQ
jgi:hypothetical protein